MHRVTHLVDAHAVVDDLLVTRASEGERRMKWLEWALEERRAGRPKIMLDDGRYREIISAIRLNKSPVDPISAEEIRFDAIRSFDLTRGELLDDRFVDVLRSAD